MFILVLLFVIIFTIFNSLITFRKVFMFDREKNAYQAFMSNESHPNFYSKFGKFPTQYLNTLYINKNNKNGKIMDLCLRDFYIASAYRPYQIAGQTYDICSYKAIQTIIEKGARFHYLDIWSSNPTNPFDETAYPIVRNKTLMPGKSGYALLFDKVCEIYKKHSWAGTKYPLILYLNLHHPVQTNKFVQNKIANILWKHFQGKFIGANYSFGKNIYPKQGYLQELTNGIISSDIQNNGRLIVYDEGNARFGGIRSISADMKTIIEFNKTNIGIVIPGDLKKISNNSYKK